MKTLFRLLRWPLGQIIIFLDWISGPKPPTHSAEVQQKHDVQTAHLKLYQFQQCPFCVITRRSIRGLGLNIEWLYESKDIIQYLDQRFAADKP